jgi:hypothetical protein
MSSNNTQSAGNGLGCGTVLGLIFITLKLTGNIGWSWTWVLAPFWIPLVFLIPAVAFLAWAGSRR